VARAVYNGQKFDSPWEAEHAERLDRWKAAGTVQEWSYNVTIPLFIGRTKVLTRTGRQAIYKLDFRVKFADGTVELHEVKSNRRRGPEFERWWLKLQIVRAMGLRITLVGCDGQPVEDVEMPAIDVVHELLDEVSGA
jgi:hypothetical protein